MVMAVDRLIAYVTPMNAYDRVYKKSLSTVKLVCLYHKKP